MKWEQGNIFIGAMACLLPFSFIGNEGLFGYQICIATCAVFMICILMGGIWLKNKAALSISGNDVFVFLYLTYGCLHLYIDRDNLPLSLYAHWLILTTVYIISRNVKTLHLSLFLWGSCTLQAVIGLGQLAGIVESNHSLFHATGCFWNPSQLGGFIACFFPLFVSELITRKYSAWYWLGILPIACAPVFSDSRAAWLACGIGILYVLPAKFKGKIKMSFVSLGLVLAGMGLYFYKPLSAAGRLYVWLVCKDMIQLDPLWGNGVHSFTGQYMLYQANYFRAHPESNFAGIATSVTTPYNEFIHSYPRGTGKHGAFIILAPAGQLLFLHPA